MMIDIIVNPDTDPAVVSLLQRQVTNHSADSIYLFPYPATTEVRVAFSHYILAATGSHLLATDYSMILSANIPL
jgi:hypothetical protein